MNPEPDTALADTQTAMVTAWLTLLEQQRRYSQATLRAYKNDLHVLCALHPDRALHTLAEKEIRHSIARLHAQGYHPRSLARALAAWRTFYQWLAPLKGMPANPAHDVRAPKAPRPLPKALSVEQAQTLLDRPGTPVPDTALQWRDQAMFELVYSSGLRLSELVSLDHRFIVEGGYESRSWLSLDQAQVRVRGKGEKERIVPVGSKALNALAQWLKARENWPQAGTTDARAALFLGRRGGRIAPRIVHEQLNRMALQAGLPMHVNPHALRHSFASHMLQSSNDIRAVQELLGHASIRTTQIYTGLDFQHLAQAYDQAHPRASRQGLHTDIAQNKQATGTDPDTALPPDAKHNRTPD